MENSQSLSSSSQEEKERDEKEIEQLLLSLPKIKGAHTFGLCLYQGFWCPTGVLPWIVSFQRHFQALDQDIILASKPKSGTTWLKALLFSVVNRSHYTPTTTPLLSSNPHELVPFFEFMLYSNNQTPDLTSIPSPRLFSTHIPYSPLPNSIKESGCKIVYICRNPFDAVVSYWHFTNQSTMSSNLSLEECVNSFCKGEEGYGPHWDHVLGYQKQSLERPNKVLFLTFEELKADTKSQVKRLAAFVGFPFSLEEEKAGVIEEIIKLCSLSNLKELEVNKTGKYGGNIYENKSYFREGEVGKWGAQLTPSMVERLDKIMQEKFEGSGFNFEVSPK